ncbi:MAG TPA: Xaa-Pro peptidase family protein [Victivallales bacterium]|nr:Xaa-Pro peptidase family protein [Victivallales bacterium]
MKIIREKIQQSIKVLRELDIDLWITFCRETDSVPDPASNLIVGSGACWLTGYFISKCGDTTVLVGQADAPDFERSGLYKNIIIYSEEVGKEFLDIIEKYNPRNIALNYSQSNYTADGLSHGLFLQIQEFLKDTPYSQKLISSEDILTRVRGRKTPEEIKLISKAAELAVQCWNKVLEKIKTGMTEIEISDLFFETINSQDCTPSFSPIVNAGSKTKPGHSAPTKAILEKGDLLHVDFGVQYEGYCSDIQRLAYFKKDNENIPLELIKAFGTVSSILHQAIELYKPGNIGHEIDGFVRKSLIEAGYSEFYHALGHQIGQAVHDGGTIVGPLWPRYRNLGAVPLEPGSTFTAEFGVTIEGIGHVNLEEDIQVTSEGGRFLCEPQRELVIMEV